MLPLLPLPVARAQDEVLRRAQRPLEMFFPFDPYLLKRSAAALGLSTSYIRCGAHHACTARPPSGAV